MLTVKNINKSYGENQQVLKDVSFELEKGDICVILGPSGSGKSTLLNIVGGLDSADSGKVTADGMDVTSCKGKKLTEYRRQKLGIIFQSYNLLPRLTTKENVRSGAYLSKNPLDVDDLLETLNLTEEKDKFPGQMSGGQQQRCAVARAIAKNPPLLLCDEPTGALDSKNSKEMMILIEKINKKYGTTMLIVTHNEIIQNMATKVIRMKDGAIQEMIRNENPIDARNLEF